MKKSGICTFTKGCPSVDLRLTQFILRAKWMEFEAHRKAYKTSHLVVQFFSSVSIKMAQLFSGASGSFFFWRMAHIFIDNRTQFVRKISRLFYNEWSYLYPERDLTSVEKAVAERMNYDKTPLALVAVKDKKFLGTICLKEFDMETRKDISPWLAGLYVKEEFRNIGIGRLLIQNIIENARLMGVDELYLSDS